MMTSLIVTGKSHFSIETLQKVFNVSKTNLALLGADEHAPQARSGPSTHRPLSPTVMDPGDKTAISVSSTAKFPTDVHTQ